MIEKTGNLFDSDAPYLAHGVNTEGVMGAGIAKTFRGNFPRNYEVYRRQCIQGQLSPGGVLVFPEKDMGGNIRLIVNLASQQRPGPDAQYHWLLESLMSFAKQAMEANRYRLYGGRVAIPEIGCGIGGLEWPKVYRTLRVIEYAYTGIEFEVWHYAG